LEAKKKADPKVEPALTSLKEEMALLSDQERTFERELDKLAEQIAQSTRTGLDLDATRRELESKEAVSQKLAEAIELHLLHLTDPSRVTLRDRAQAIIE
jgi:uncharacterized protein with von Willebrand factor type A (vWA) domain